jgi:hypothetical protein
MKKRNFREIYVANAFTGTCKQQAELQETFFNFICRGINYGRKYKRHLKFSRGTIRFGW